jgi:ribosomal protein L19
MNDSRAGAVNRAGAASERRISFLRNLLLVAALTGAIGAQAQNCFPPPSGLIGWWPGDGSATNLAGTNVATLFSNATANAVGMVGQAFGFNGTTAYVSIPDATNLRPTNFTVEAWVKFNSLTSTGNSAAGQQYIVFKQNTRTTGFEGIYLAKERRTGGDIFVFGTTSSAGVGVEVDSTAAIATNVWYHVAGVRGPNFIQLYVNGQFIGQTTVTFAQNYGTLPLYFGTSGQSYWDHKLSGTLDEVSLYNRPLTSNEIAGVYAAGASGKCKPGAGIIITTQPQTQTVVAGSNATFTVAASGAPPLSYQWLFNGGPIGGANGTNLVLTNVQPASNGNYSVVITNASTAVTSAVAVLTVIVPPTITADPQSATLIVGATANFTGAASGTAPLGYQWKRNGTNLTNGGRVSGATTTNLVITSVQTADAGNYTLTATNAGGSATSAIATLIVNAPPSITSQPSNQNVVVGANVGFSVTASGTAPLSYRWLRGGNPLSDIGNVSGSSSPTLNLTGAQLSDSDNYQVVITNVAGSVTSIVATLTVVPPPVPPSITAPPTNQVVTAGTNVSFSVNASGTAPLTYLWLKNGSTLSNGGNVTGAGTATLNLSNVQSGDAANYQVIVTNLGGSVTSIVASLTVNIPPSISSQPASKSVNLGSNVTFTVAASGTAPLAYQWTFNGTNLSDGGQFSGTGTALLSVSNLIADNAGGFAVFITNVAGSVTSLVATLTVNLPGSCVPAPAGLVGWWPGDGTAQDISGTNNGILQGGAIATATGENGQAFKFDGTNAYIEVPNAPALNPTNLTVECWVNFNLMDTPGNSTVGAQYIVFKQNTQTLAFEGYNLSKHRYAYDIIVWEVTSATGVAVQINGVTPITSNTWYHVVGIRGPDFVQLYINGNLEAQTNVSFPQDYGPYSLFFGTSHQSYWDRKLSGLLDEVSLYNRALTSNEVTALYAAGSAGKCKGGIQQPVVITQPQSQNVVVGSNATFTVLAGGTPPLSYRWLRGGLPLSDGGNISGATNSTLTLSSVQFSDAADFQVVITNMGGSVTSLVATLTVNPAPVPPTIVTPPTIQVVKAGSNASFSVSASGTMPLSYQWLKNGGTLTNGGAISGSTTATLAITGAQTNDAGNYQVVVTNIAGSVTSIVATLTVNLPPSITTQPSGQTVNVGSSAAFLVVAGGTAPLNYQWRFNGSNLANGGQFSGVNTSSLTISNAQPGNAGGYSVFITNIAGNTTSTTATLAINTGGNCFPAPSGLVSWWTGDGNALDLAGVNNGTLQGGATASGVGEVGAAFTFDGTNNYVSIPDSASLRPSVFTVECWVRFNNLNSAGNSQAGQQYIVFKQNTRTANFEGIYLAKERRTSSDIFVFGVSSSGGAGVEVDSTAAIVTNTWYHLAAVRGTNFIQLYVNGVFIGQASVTFPQNYGTLPMFFGSSGQSYWDRKLSGSLDEVALYNRPLASNEIAAIFAAGAAGKCKGASAPAIITQPANQVLTLGGVENFSVVAAGTAPLSYFWFKDSFLQTNGGRISGATSATLTISNAQASDIGNYQVIVSNSLGTAVSAVASLSTGIPPGNDNFANATAISGSSGSVSGNNANATKQSGEPNHAGNAGGPSVWYNWTAPSTSPVTFDTAMSAFDTLLAVYTGNSVNALTLVASNDDLSPNSSRSRLTFTPVAGTVYHVAVDGNNGANGNITLRWVQASVPLPDLAVIGSAVNPQIVTQTFASNSCAVLEGLIQAGTRRLIRFDTQTANQGTGDLMFGNPASNPLFVFAPCHAHYHFQNYMSYRLRDSNGQLAAVGLKVGFCILDVFRWQPGAPNQSKYTCSNQGIQVGWGDLYDNTLDGQWIDITGLPDGNYTMELDANPQGIIQESDYSNNLTTVPVAIGNPLAPPLNDNFASPQTLLGGFTSVPGVTGNATKQAGEPNHAGNAGGHSVWYQWTAVSTKAVTIDTLGSGFNTLLAVYTGTTLSGLSLVASNDDISAGTQQSSVTFNATAGTIYKIAVDGFNGASGNLILTLNQTIQNDAFASCQFVGGPTGIAYGANSGATKEAGEPNHAGNTGGASIWYCWTAPISGTVTFDTTGSSFNTLLAAYSGTAVSSLNLMASNDDIDAPNNNFASRITFNATGLTMYKIAIDGFNGATGDTVLTWNLQAAAGQSMAGLSNPTIAAISQPGGPKLYSGFGPEGEFRLTIAGMPQMQYRIETSCDLVNWAPSITTLSDDTGTAYFTDKTTMNPTLHSAIGDPVCNSGQVTGVPVQNKGRFYRAIAMPPKQ